MTLNLIVLGILGASCVIAQPEFPGIKVVMESYSRCDPYDKDLNCHPWARETVLATASEILRTFSEWDAETNLLRRSYGRRWRTDRYIQLDFITGKKFTIVGKSINVGEVNFDPSRQCLVSRASAAGGSDPKSKFLREDIVRAFRAFVIERYGSGPDRTRAVTTEWRLPNYDCALVKKTLTAVAHDGTETKLTFSIATEITIGDVESDPRWNPQCEEVDPETYAHAHFVREHVALRHYTLPDAEKAYEQYKTSSDHELNEYFQRLWMRAHEVK